MDEHEYYGRTGEILMDNSQYHSTLLDNSPGLIAVVNAKDHLISYANARFSQFFGDKFQERSDTLTIWDVVEPTQHALLAFHLEQVATLPIHQSKYVIYRVRDQKGHYESFYIYISLTKSPMGHTAYYLVMFPTFSNWKQPYLSYETKELFLEQFSEHSFGALEWVSGSDFLFCSSGFLTICEIPEEVYKLDLETVFEFIHPDDRDRVEKLARNAVGEMQDFSGEFRIITRQGNYKILSFVGKIVQSDEGQLVKVVGSVMDISEQRKIQQNLDHHVKELHRSNHELEEFAYVASHDLQEPLRKISTFCDRLSEKYADQLQGDGAMYLDRIMASAENMRILIQDLLEFSRITRTSEPFHQVDLNLVLQQVRSDLEILMEETGTDLHYQGLPTISGSVSQLIQLFSNLIHNAIKFRKEGIHPKIQIRSELAQKSDKSPFGLSTDQAYIKLTIQDNGIGFEEEYSGKIFQIFQRLHGKAEYPGSGIGLSICKKIVEYHKGAIFARSSFGQGAEFMIILPIS